MYKFLNTTLISQNIEISNNTKLFCFKISNKPGLTQMKNFCIEKFSVGFNFMFPKQAINIILNLKVVYFSIHI